MQDQTVEDQTLLRRRRDVLGMTQDELGKAVGVDALTVSRWERGESLPREKIWKKLAKVTGLPADDLMQDLLRRKVRAA